MKYKVSFIYLTKSETFLESLISIILFFMIVPNPASSNNEGFVGASCANPYISAPNKSNQILNHEPLNPVLPVIKLFCHEKCVY